MVHTCGLEKVYKHSYLHLKLIKTVRVDLWFKKTFERHISDRMLGFYFKINLMLCVHCGDHLSAELLMSFMYKVPDLVLQLFSLLQVQ